MMMTNKNDQLYPDESSNLDVFGHLEELRKRIIYSLIFLTIFTIICFLNGTYLIEIAKKPAENLINNFIFITPSEVFISYFKISLLSGLILSFPFILQQIWIFVAPAIEYNKKVNAVYWMSFALLFLVLGVSFSYYIALPAALKFLIGFGKGIAEANITINKYISFFAAFMLIGGLMFEIPIIIGLLTDIGLLGPKFLRSKRQYAVIIILIIAAIVTPTQDVLNLLIFSVPMIMLYEIGIIISSIIHRSKKEREEQ